MLHRFVLNCTYQFLLYSVLHGTILNYVISYDIHVYTCVGMDLKTPVGTLSGSTRGLHHRGHGGGKAASEKFWVAVKELHVSFHNI